MRFQLSLLLGIASLFFLTGFDEDDLQREQVSQREDIRQMKEKISQVENDMRAAQAQTEALKTELKAVKADLAGLQEMRKEIDRLDGLIKKLDAAREQDKKIIVDEVGKAIAQLKKDSSPSGGKPKTPKVQKPGVEEGVEHVVQKGEYLAVIAEAYGVTVPAIKEANQLKSNELKVGQKLFIPAKK